MVNLPEQGQRHAVRLCQGLSPRLEGKLYATFFRGTKEGQ